jgi:hypothetical protein
VPVTGSTNTANASAYAAAINAAFLTGSDGQGLNIANTGAGSANAACVSGVAGR